MARTPTGAACCAPSGIPVRRWTSTGWMWRFASRAGSIEVCVNGAGIPFDEEVAKKVLSEDEIDILVTLHDGDASGFGLWLRPDL